MVYSSRCFCGGLLLVVVVQLLLTFASTAIPKLISRKAAFQDFIDDYNVSQCELSYRRPKTCFRERFPAAVLVGTEVKLATCPLSSFASNAVFTDDVNGTAATAPINDTSNISDDDIKTEEPIRPFDEWQREKLEAQSKVVQTPTGPSSPESPSAPHGHNAARTNADHPGGKAVGSPPATPSGHPAQPSAGHHPALVAPHRNYASKECGAKIIQTNDETQHANAVLNEKERDEYLLNPCETKQAKFFVIELCETIRPTTVDLANFELFSSSPKLFKVWSSVRFPSSEWSLLGEWTAQDQRVIQSFPVVASDDAKFIKVELFSHYGSEHFCPVSLIRVFGVSIMEQYEMDYQATENAIVPPAAPPSVQPIETKITRTENVSEKNVTTATSGTQTESSETKKNLLGSAKDAVVNIAKNVIGKAQGLLGAKKSPRNCSALCPQRHTVNEKIVFWLRMCHACPAAVRGRTSMSGTSVSWRLCRAFAPPHLLFPYESSERSRKFPDDAQIDSKPKRVEEEFDDDDNDGRQVERGQTHTTAEKGKVGLDGAAKEMDLKDLPPTCRRWTEMTRFWKTLELVKRESAKRREEQERIRMKNEVEEARNRTTPLPTPQVISLPGSASSSKESIFFRLNNRIKQLEINISLSSQYLSELSLNYRRQMEDIQKLYNRTVRSVNETARKTEEGLSVSRQEIEDVREDVKSLANKVESIKETQISFIAEMWTWHAYFLCAETLVVVLILYCCCGIGRGGRGLREEDVRRLVRQQADELHRPMANGHVITAVANGHVRLNGHVARRPADCYDESETESLLTANNNQCDISRQSSAPESMTNSLHTESECEIGFGTASGDCNALEGLNGSPRRSSSALAERRPTAKERKRRRNRLHAAAKLHSCDPPSASSGIPGAAPGTPTPDSFGFAPITALGVLPAAGVRTPTKDENWPICSNGHATPPPAASVATARRKTSPGWFGVGVKGGKKTGLGAAGKHGKVKPSGDLLRKPVTQWWTGLESGSTATATNRTTSLDNRFGLLQSPKKK